MDTQLQRIFTYVTSRGFDIDRIQKAYRIASTIHAEQKRKSGDPYISHLIAVTAYLTEYNADEDSIVAGFLHDSVEDTEYTLEDVEQEFGPAVRKLIHGMTKFSKKDFKDEATMDRKIESLRKWFEVMQEDIRVAIIKLIDRLHNMETLHFHGNVDKEYLIAKETLDIHVKIARKLGLYEIQAELERLSFPYTDPKNADLFTSIRATEEEISTHALPRIQHRISGQDTDNRIKAINHHPLSFSDIFEFGLHAKEHIEGAIPQIITITTSTIKDCYYVLYLLHSIWKVERGSFEDYINNPAVSGYRGLHTKVILAGGREVLFKIMTEEMLEYRKYGVTKFCFQETQDLSTYQRLPEWISRISHVVKGDHNNSELFWEQLQNDILAESITIYTDQKGAPSLLLPANSTALDAAFYAYREQGLYTTEIYVNGRHVPFYHHIKADDTLMFMFNTTMTVSHEWIQFVDTSFASTYIKEGLKTYDTYSKIHRGREILQEAFFQQGKGLLEELQLKRTNELLEYFTLTSLDDLFEKIAEGEILPEKVTAFLYPKPSLVPSGPQIIKANGSLLAITKLFDNIPITLREKLHWSIKTTRALCHITCTAPDLSTKQWRQLLHYFDTAEGVSVVVRSNSWDYYKKFLYIPLINILFGIDPLVAQHLLHFMGPMELTMIRFVASSFFLYLFIVLTSPYRKSTKQLPLVHPITIVLSALVLGLAFSSYQSLLNGTIPSSYMLTMQTMAWVFVFVQLLRYHRGNLLPMTLSVITMIVGLTLFFSNGAWDTLAKFWTFGAACAYGCYTYINTYFHAKEKVDIRHQQLLLMTFIYASIFSIIALILLPTSPGHLTPTLVIGAAVYSIIFTCIPYILHGKLLRQFKDRVTVDTKMINTAFFITLGSEIVLLHMYPSIEKILTIITIYSALFLLLPLLTPKRVK